MVRLKTSLIIKILVGCLLFWSMISYFTKVEHPIDQPNIDKQNYAARLRVDTNDHKEPIEPSNDIGSAVYKEGVKGNYEPLNLVPRAGPGENGRGVHLEQDEIAAGQASVSEYGFNQVASKKISMDRRIKDTRQPECQFWSYPTKLPTASVIIVFVNEGFSTLMRTVHSVINTSPPELLHEIILVDDFSTKKDLKEYLENYIKQFNGKVKLLRNPKQEGLVRSRVVGAEHATGDVIVILDAHCECVTNWLPPLLDRIAVNKKTVACPIVDGIDWNTLEHTNMYGSSLKRGIWEWGFLYKETDVPRKELDKHKYRSEAYKSPTHAGGLLAIDREWFFQLGGYDPGIKIWGAEQYELSFKAWQCGGSVEWVPCSIVAHIYRGPRTESVHPIGGNPFQSKINHMRLAEVWMDEYKEYFYIRDPPISKLDFGDVSEQKAIRKKLDCKPFSWFMHEVAYDMPEKFPLPPKNKVWGEAKNSEHRVCMDIRAAGYGHPIGVGGCHHQGGSQMFRINVEGEMSSDEQCFVSDKDLIIKKFCLDHQGVWNPIGEWEYDEVENTIKSNKEKTCITTDGINLRLEKCDGQNPSQKWHFTPVYYGV